MLGLQEILIISAIVAGALVIPRIMAQQKRTPRLVRPPKRLSGKVRLGIVVSVVFPLVIAAFMQPWHKDTINYLYIGLGPVILAWLLFWVFQGYKRR